MKIFATIALSLIEIAAALVLILSTLCAFSSGGGDRSPYVICALASLAVIVAATSAINRLNRKK